MSDDNLKKNVGAPSIPGPSDTGVSSTATPLMDQGSPTPLPQTQTSATADASLTTPNSANTNGEDSVVSEDKKDGGQNIPLASGEPESVVTSPHTPKKYGGKKIIATIFGVLLLIGGVAAGVILVQRQQEISERAASGKECSQSPNCILLDEPGNSGSFIAPRAIVAVLITAKDVFAYQPGDTNDGCYHVVIDGTYLSWNRVGTGPDCKDVSNVQVKMVEGGQITPTLAPTPTETPPPGETPTPKPTSPPVKSARCLNVKAYDANWNVLSSDDLKNLSPGNTVRFAVAGEATSGSFDKARFSLNNSSLGETSNKKPGTQEFYVEYEIPENVTDFQVKGEVHHSELGWI